MEQEDYEKKISKKNGTKSSDRLIENQDEISLIMLLNKLQEAADLKGLSKLSKIGDKVWEKTPEYLLDIIA